MKKKAGYLKVANTNIQWGQSVTSKTEQWTRVNFARIFDTSNISIVASMKTGYFNYENPILISNVSRDGFDLKIGYKSYYVKDVAFSYIAIAQK